MSASSIPRSYFLRHFDLHTLYCAARTFKSLLKQLQKNLITRSQ